MIAYTEDKKRYNLDTDNFIDEGEYGRVYLTSNNKCLKIFKQSISRKDKMSFDEDVFNIIRKLKPKNIYTLGDLYYNKSLTRILGYLSEYYSKEDINILTMPVDYTFDNLCSLYDRYLVKERFNNHFMYPFYAVCNKEASEFKVQKEELSYVKWYSIDKVIEMIKEGNKELVFKKEEIPLFEKLKNIEL